MVKRKVEGDALVVCADDGRPLFSMRESIEVARAVVGVEGDVVEEASRHFGDEVMALTTVCSDLTVDFSRATSVSSSALAALVVARQQLKRRPGARLRITGLPPEVEVRLAEAGMEGFIEV